MPAVLGLLVALAAAGEGEHALELATDLVREVPARQARSPGAEEAQRWVEARLEERGLRPQRIPGGVPEGTVVACREGASEATVLLLAHTDAVHPEVAGANDNAAAVGVLLVVAERLPERPPRRVCLAFPGGEERGLLGSRALARAWREVPLDQVMSLDLVGRGLLTHNGLGPAWGRHRLRALLHAAPADVPYAYRAVSHAWPHMERSDHAPFAWQGIPASHLMARPPQGFDVAYHTRDDTPERLQAPTLAAAVRAVEGVVRAPPLPRDRQGEPAWVLPATTVVVPGALTWALLVLFAGAGLAGAVSGVGGSGRHHGAVLAKGALGALLAPLSFGAAVAVAAMGRPLDGALAGPALVAGWCAGGLWALGWRWRLGAPLARRAALAWSAVLAGLGLWAGGPLLALPLAMGLLGVGLASSRPAGGRLAGVLVALATPLYLLRADAARELAFHGLFPAGALSWALAFGVLTGPGLLLLLAERPSPRLRRHLVGLLVAALALAVLGAWLTDPHAPPFEARERLSAR